MKPKVRHTLRSNDDYERRRQRRVLFASLFIIAIMVFSTFAYYITGTNGQDQLVYGDYEFSLKPIDYGSVWITYINNQEVEFQTLPVQVTYLQVDPTAIDLLRNANNIVLTADTNITMEDASFIDYARLQLGLAIPKTMNAITAANEQYTLPVVDCSMASPQMPVVYFTMSNETGVTVEGSCILLNGQITDILRLKDRIIFEYYDILKNGQVVE